MNIIVTTFTNPFSFFCIADDSNWHHDVEYNENEVNTIEKITDFDHGDYVAVMWKNKWVRGIVSMESQILIWLIDYGIFLQPTKQNCCTDLPLHFRKLPSKVFEASIQGVLPTDKIIGSWSLGSTGQVQFDNVMTASWTPGATERVKTLLQQSEKTYFSPIAILSTEHNDVVLGDLYLKLPFKGIVNIVDELLEWPVFLEQNKEAYLQNLSPCYKSRRRHRYCLLKPYTQGFNLPTITFKTTIEEYSAILAKVPDIDTLLNQRDYHEDDCGSTVVGTVVEKEKRDKSAYKITPADIEKYSKRFITINGKEYNVLTILINKSRDFNMCERYKDHDLKSIGRGISYRPADF